jgi:Fe-S-cluster containining protein
MRCIGNRCAALQGEVGRATACAVYAVRPEVCRACEPGDDACAIARAHFGLPLLDPGPQPGGTPFP